MVAWRGGQEFVIADPHRVQTGGVIGQRDQSGVERTALEPRNPLAGEVLAQEQAQLRKALAQQRQGLRQEERRDGGDHAQPETAGKWLAGALGGLHQVFHPGQHVLGAPNRLLAHRSQDHAGTGAVHHRRAKRTLQFLYAGGQGRLGDEGRLRRAAERAMLRQQSEVLQLSKRRQHERQIGSGYARRKNNRFAAQHRTPISKACGGSTAAPPKDLPCSASAKSFPTSRSRA